MFSAVELIQTEITPTIASILYLQFNVLCCTA
jgi:hypothetical protein